MKWGRVTEIRTLANNEVLQRAMDRLTSAAATRRTSAGRRAGRACLRSVEVTHQIYGHLVPS
jgi:hypothetical protein